MLISKFENNDLTVELATKFKLFCVCIEMNTSTNDCDFRSETKTMRLRPNKWATGRWLGVVSDLGDSQLEGNSKTYSGPEIYQESTTRHGNSTGILE